MARSKAEPSEPQTKTFAHITNGRLMAYLENWRYHSIVDALRFMHVERQDAEDAAKRCGKAEFGTTFEVGDAKIRIVEKKTD